MDALRAASAHAGNAEENRERRGAPGPQDSRPQGAPGHDPYDTSSQGALPVRGAQPQGGHRGQPPESQDDGGWSWFGAPRQQPAAADPAPSAPDRSGPDAGQARPGPVRPGPASPYPPAAATGRQAPPAPARDRSPAEAEAPQDHPVPGGDRPVRRFAVPERRPTPEQLAAHREGRQQPAPGRPAADQSPVARQPVAQPPAARPDAAQPPAAQPPAAPPSAAPQPRQTPPSPAPSRPLDARPNSPDAILINATMEAITPASDKVIAYFYATLFVHNPHLRELFPASMDHQRDRLLRSLLIAAKHIDDIEFLTQYLSNLGRGHRKYGTRSDHYPAVGEALIEALAKYAGEVWTQETEEAWVRAYTTISQIMIDSAAADERVAPPWWQAEIVAHQPRTSDIAVITMRPDQPYPFLAGQYTTMETPWWPRVWRHYSFASAPSPDGLLTFHVKAIPAGWVSTALVHRARPGDVVRLGPPAGSMVVDHNSSNGLLCLGGGTGIAPIKALVEDVAGSGTRRPVEVFYGARSDDDLYDLDTMARLAKQHSWLTVRPVVDGPTQNLAGPLPDIVRKYGPWHSFDAYLSGPPGMIRSGVDTLTGIGIPSHRIRHDFVGDLVAAAD